MTKAQPAVIEPQEDGPLLVKGLEDLRLDDGSRARTKSVTALCRCGASGNKPFCDGSHAKVDFSSAAPPDVSRRDKVHRYTGEAVTVHYNALLCSHAGACSASLPSAFDPSRRPWIVPDNADVADIETVIAACPSGALRYSLADGEPRQRHGEGCFIAVEPDGPYHVQNIELENGRWPEGANPNKYVLCRCGQSGNKPFCDGTHQDVGWRAKE